MYMSEKEKARLQAEIKECQLKLNIIEKTQHNTKQEEYDKHFHESDEFLNDVPLMVDILANDVIVHVEFNSPLCLSNKGTATEWDFSKTYFMEMFNSFHKHHNVQYMKDHESQKDEFG